MNSKPQKRILITGAGGASAIAFFNDVKDRFDLDFCMADISPNSSGLYLVPKSNRFILPRGDSEEFTHTVLELCLANNIEAVLPTVDNELLPLASARSRFLDANIGVLVAPENCLEICEDKFRLMEFLAEKIGFYGFAKINRHFDPTQFAMPFIAKPRRGSGSRDINLIRSIRAFERIPKDGSFMAQTFFPGKEYSVDVYISQAGDALGCVVRERIKVDSGIAVISQTVRYPALCEKALHIAGLVGLRGVANCQFKTDTDGEPQLLEINARFPGTMPLTVEAGVNMPAMCLREYLGQPNEARHEYREVVMVRTWQEAFISPAEFADQAL